MLTREVAGHDGTPLFTRFLLPGNEPIRATVVLIHGAFEHSGRFEHIMHTLAGWGFGSLAYDQRGHGRSGGRPIFLKSFAEYVHDLDAVLRHHSADLRGPVVLLGHSMGGLVVIRHRQQLRQEHAIAGSVLTSPFLAPSAPIPAWKKSLSKLVVGIAPKIAMDNGLPMEKLSHDPQVEVAYRQDKLVHKKATAGWFEALMAAAHEARVDHHRSLGPMYFLVAADDYLVQVSAAQRFYESLPESMGKHWQLFPDCYHELLQEDATRRAPVLDALKAALDSLTGSAAA